MGYTYITTTKIELILDNLRKSYLGKDYHVLTKNCNHFVSDFIYQLTSKNIPSWLTRMINISICCKCCISNELIFQLKIPPNKNINELQNEKSISSSNNSSRSSYASKIMTFLLESSYYHTMETSNKKKKKNNDKNNKSNNNNQKLIEINVNNINNNKKDDDGYFETKSDSENEDIDLSKNESVLLSSKVYHTTINFDGKNKSKLKFKDKYDDLLLKNNDKNNINEISNKEA